MFCCGCRKEARPARTVGESGGAIAFAYPGQNPFQPVASYSTIRRVQYPPDSYMQTMATYATPVPRSQRAVANTGATAAAPPEMIVQRDFRKVSGISSDMFRQIEAVEKQYDPTTATLIEAVERRGDMIVRLLDPRMLGRGGVDAHNQYVSTSVSGQIVQFVEIIKRPGQSLGLYIREGDGFTTADGVFISRIEPQSPVYTSGVLKLGDEVLAVNLVDVRRMNLDDVVIVMSIPRRLVLTIRSRTGLSFRQGVSPASSLQPNSFPDTSPYPQTPVVVVKKEMTRVQDPYDMEEVAVREEEARRLHEELKSMNRGLSVDEDGLMTRPSSRLSVVRPSSRNILRPMTHARDDTYVQIYQKAADARTRPYRHNSSNLNRIYPRTLENLVEEDDDLHSGYVSDTLITGGMSGRKSATLSRMSGLHRSGNGPRSGRYSSMSSARYWDEDPRSDPLRPGSALAILPTISDDYLDRYSRPLSRLSLRSGTPTGLPPGMRHARPLQDPSNSLIRSSLSSHALSRRRGSGRRPVPLMDGTASDSESNARPYARNQMLLDRYSRLSASGRTSVLSDRVRTNSLPRPAGYGSGGRRHHMAAGHSRLSGRMSSQQQYQSSVPYDEDSDGTTSAPENTLLLERQRRQQELAASRRRAVSPPGGYSSSEYRQWMTRAPSTSALYDVVRRPGSRIGATLPSGLSNHSLSKIAHSAESLLDTIRLEAQKNLLVDLYGNRGAVAAARRSPASLLLDSGDNDRSSSRLKHQQRLRTTAGSGGPDFGSRASAGGTAVIPNPTPVRPSDDSRMHLLTLNPREFFKYKYDKSTNQIVSTDARDALHSSLSSATADGRENLTTPVSLLASHTTDGSLWSGMGFSGLLWIHLLAGRGLRATGPATSAPVAVSGTSKQSAVVGLNRDLYCVIECERVHRARTVVRSGESSFDWDEVFELDILDCKEVSFLLYSWDPESKHKLCYKGIVNLMSLSLSKTPVHSLALKMEPRGTLYIKMRYKEPAIAFQRPLPSPSTSSSGIFAVDVETVVKRENSGSRVPLLLKRCIDEVERRGLQVVGIYRLCGSAVRKKMLREAFEKNAWLVDLSVEHVPDINVITSLIKDYLRDVPEPLFTKAMFDMMVDGLSVCLPDDPNGNSKLMFSIIECLTEISAACVQFVMDHLKLVVSHQDKNKMSTQALAQIFGPLFSCHYESDNIHKSVEVFKFLLDMWPAPRSRTQHSGQTASTKEVTADAGK